MICNNARKDNTFTSMTSFNSFQRFISDVKISYHISIVNTFESVVNIP